MAEASVRPMRADALRNRALILEAARERITVRGPDVGMDEIAREAGLAVGTLYRHFPTKNDLVAAAVGAFVVDVAEQAEAAVSRVAQGGRAFDQLAGFLHDTIHAASTNQAVKAAAVALNADVDDPENLQRAHVALQSLIDAARHDGAVRSDLSIDDFYLLLSSAPSRQPPDVLRRWVDLTLFGIAGPASR